MQAELIDLGTCQQCHGSLCMSGPDVVCSDCGTPVKDHPITKNQPKEKQRPFPAVPPNQMAVTWQDRICKLEGLVHELQLDPAEGDPNISILLEPALLLGFFWCDGLSSSTVRKDGEKPLEPDEEETACGAGDDDDDETVAVAANSSCSALDAFRTHTVLPISVTVADT